ncbi:MAG: hypothetical protein M1267_02160 [Candidatus Thermoplasmatota archaeon]|nr:hypothetical protein [Candidatus Thermoplasmatota archaeon]MCL5800683.1 hypothetical protein [Candidatus Thermoplasmatota archaeon]
MPRIVVRCSKCNEPFVLDYTGGDLMRFDTGGNRNTLCPKCRSEGRNVPMHHSKGKGSDENGHT